MNITPLIETTVAQSARRPWLVTLAALLLSALGLYYTIAHFAINTDTARLISTDIEWRKNEAAFDAAFPGMANLTLVVMESDNSERVEKGAAALAEALTKKPDLFKTVSRPDALPFFAQNGLLLMPQADLDKTLRSLREARGLIGPIAADPTLRGVLRPIQGAAQGAAAGQTTLDPVVPLMTRIAGTIEGVLGGGKDPLAWRAMLASSMPGQSTDGPQRKLILVQPTLDFGALQPGAAASDQIRASARDLGLTEANGVRVRLTGAVPLADEEFATVTENIELNLGLTILAVALILWAALRSGKIIFAVLVTLFAGLFITSGLGLLLVGELNLISVAFAVLFIGLGVDFGIQFAMRYRAERHALGELQPALAGTARGVGLSLTLAMVSLVAGFFSFLPTEFRGVSELGLIAGMGMVIAFLAAITILPALLALLKPPPEGKPVETAALAKVDHWILQNRKLVLILTAVVVLAGTPALLKLPFDSNPMNLRDQRVESVATYLDLSRDADTAPNSINILLPPADVAFMSQKLAALPEVDRVVSLGVFAPADQTQKLAAISQTSRLMREPLNPRGRVPAPTDADNLTALQQTSGALDAALQKQTTGPSADTARRLKAALDKLAAAEPARRDVAQQALTAELEPMLIQVRGLLRPERITEARIPPELRSMWVAPDGRARIEVTPKGDGNNNEVLRRFADAVRAVAPNATGAPITIVESGATVVRAFATAGIVALIAIFIILWVALRNALDVVLTLGPLVLAGIMSLQAAYLLGIPLNFASIIALPLMFGVGVAFHIYYIIAWRAGMADMLASSLTRAIFFSALATGVAFGSLSVSSHPGTASMGQLLAVSLFFTLLAAFIIVPAFLGPPRELPAGADKPKLMH